MILLAAFGLSFWMLVLFIFCVVCVSAFEFINGFHDTANAVATVIYTKSLKPVQAVVWSGIMNFFGVLASMQLFGMAVAIKIAELLPVDAFINQSNGQSAAMILAVLLSAMAWNLLTWYFGIPCSSSHTLIGAILGVGLVYTYLPENTTFVGVNWNEAKKIGNSLLFSPAFGFTMAIALMFILRSVVSNKQIFREPSSESSPPLWIRAILITTCTLVSFFHGSNDGQKGVGLLLIVLMCFLPYQYALSPDYTPEAFKTHLINIRKSLPDESSTAYSVFSKELTTTKDVINDLENKVLSSSSEKSDRLAIRKRAMLLQKNLKVLLETPGIIQKDADRAVIKGEIKAFEKYTHAAPTWAILLISLSLGIGTMIGWKRIVVTIGEKIGKRHMTYAEGATAEVIASTTIGLASQFGLPVSTTHVLSSGVAGAMVASKGTKNLQRSTITNIALAWVLTLPVTIILSGALYLLFRLFA